MSSPAYQSGPASDGLAPFDRAFFLACYQDFLQFVDTLPVGTSHEAIALCVNVYACGIFRAARFYRPGTPAEIQGIIVQNLLPQALRRQQENKESGLASVLSRDTLAALAVPDQPRPVIRALPAGPSTPDQKPPTSAGRADQSGQKYRAS